jgi:hypothetical protein
MNGLRDVVQLRHRRQNDDPVHVRPGNEAENVGEEAFAAYVAGMYHKLVTGRAADFQNTALDGIDVQRVRVVVNQSDQEGAARGKAPGLGARHVIQLADHLQHVLACRGIDFRRVVDHARNRFLGYAGQSRDVTDRGLAVPAGIVVRTFLNHFVCIQNLNRITSAHHPGL